MQHSLIFFFRWINIRLYYAVMAFVIPFYIIFDPRGRKAIYNYFHKRHGLSPLNAAWHTYLDFFSFGQVIIDRFANYAGYKFEITTEGLDTYNQLAGGESGFMQLSSHVGNYELAGYHLKAEKKSIHALIFAGETETVMENRRKMFEGHNIDMIPMREDMSHVFAINTALADGDIVSMPSDRVFGSQKTEVCTFFGAEAHFPNGPFAIAAMRGIPMLPVFVMKDGVKRYHIIVNRIDFPAEAPRKERAHIMAQEYAKCLEAALKRYPNQWFNYFEFWND